MLEAVVAVLTIVFMQEENNTVVAVALVEEATVAKVAVAVGFLALTRAPQSL